MTQQAEIFEADRENLDTTKFWDSWRRQIWLLKTQDCTLIKEKFC